MNSKTIAILKEIKNKVEQFSKLSKKYTLGHSYYKSNLKELKLDLTGHLKRISNLSLFKTSKAEEVIRAFLQIAQPTQKDCEEIIEKISYFIQDLELEVESSSSFNERIYNKGSPFDFHNDIKEILNESKRQIFIVEPFINEDLLEITLRGIDNKLDILILTNSNNANKRGKFTKISNMFKAQHKGKFETRESTEIHDRGVFIDNLIGWVMGQSIKDAGKKPTYLIKLQNPKKLEDIYNNIWKQSKKVN